MRSSYSPRRAAASSHGVSGHSYDKLLVQQWASPGARLVRDLDSAGPLVAQGTSASTAVAPRAYHAPAATGGLNMSGSSSPAAPLVRGSSAAAIVQTITSHTESTLRGAGYHTPSKRLSPRGSWRVLFSTSPPEKPTASPPLPPSSERTRTIDAVPRGNQQPATFREHVTSAASFASGAMHGQPVGLRNVHASAPTSPQPHQPPPTGVLALAQSVDDAVIALLVETQLVREQVALAKQ